MNVSSNFSQAIFHWKEQFGNYLNSFSDRLESIMPDAAAMDVRLRARLSYMEFAGIVLCCSMIAVFVYLIRINVGGPVDFTYYMNDSIRTNFIYGYWLLPIFQLLHKLPFEIAYILWCLINLGGAFFALRVFGGKPALVIMTYQFLTCIYFGQLSGVLAGGLALGWYGINHSRWNLAGLGFMVAAAKYQVGVPLGLCLIWYSGIPFKKCLRLVPVPIIILISSFILYPAWPLQSIQTLIYYSGGNGYTYFGITFWIYMSAWALLFWIPALLLPMTKTHRFLAFFCLTSFATPYFQHLDLLTLFSFPLGWLQAVGYVGFLFPFINITAIRLAVIVPFSIYLMVIAPASVRWIKTLKK
jgi:hypothetical protein